jgi:hypothetical protein
MKNVLFITNAVFLGIILFMSCNKADLAAAAVTPEPCNPCTDHTSTPFTGIKPSLAKKLFTDYKILNQPKLLIDKKIPDANSIWFSLESLKNFIWKIEQETCKHPCANPLQLGIRIYYGRYPSEMTEPGLAGLPTSYAQHHTLFMVPTYQDFVNSAVHWDFDPRSWGTDNCKPTPMSDLYNNPSFVLANKEMLVFSIKEDQYFKSADGTLQWIMNHGDMSPPGTIVGMGLN